MKPKFVHDCPSCEFIEHYHLEGKKPVDLYVCNPGTEHVNIIARFGEDYNYTSGLLFCSGLNPVLTYGYEQALKVGKIPASVERERIAQQFDRQKSELATLVFIEKKIFSKVMDWADEVKTLIDPAGEIK